MSGEKITICPEKSLDPDVKIGFIGAGRMAQALCQGFMKAKLVKPCNVLSSSNGCGLNDADLKDMQNLGSCITESNFDIVKHSDIIIIAVKPHLVANVLKEISCPDLKTKLIVSIAAGVTLERMEKLLPPCTRVIRIMLNTPSLVNCGATVCAPGYAAKNEDYTRIIELFSTVGICQLIPERLMDGVTGLSNAGPAYAFQMIEAMSDGGVKQGLPRDMATRLAAQTILGASRMVLETGLHPGALKDAITSPGGTTIAGLHELERGAMRSTLINAVEAAAKRAKELSQSPC